MLMLYDMHFRNSECPLQNMVYSNFWQKNLRLKIDRKSIYIIGEVNNTFKVQN